MTSAEMHNEEEDSAIDEYEERTRHDRQPSVGDEMKLPFSVRFISFVLGAAVLLPWNGVCVLLW